MPLPTTTQPAIKHGWVRAIVLFIVYLGISLLAAFVAGVLVARQHTDWNMVQIAQSEPFQFQATLFTALCAIPAALLFRRFIDKKPVISLGFAWRGFQRQAGIGFLLGPALLGIGSLILFFTGYIVWTDTSLNGIALLSSLGYMLLIALEEEIIFRGYLLNNLMDSMNKWTALGIGTLLFVLVHLGNQHLNVIALINLVAGGILLGINFMYTRNLWFSILFHFSWNFIQGPVLGYQVSGIEGHSLWQMEIAGNPLLTGNGFGFEGSVIATVVLIIGILLCLERRWWVPA